MKKFLLALSCCLAVAACGASSSSTAATCVNQYWDGTVGTCLPAGWHIIDRAALDQRGVPAEVVVAFQADTPISGQFVTVTVTRELLTKQMTSTDYSAASVQSVSAMAGYQEVDSQAIQIDGNNVTLHIFNAQPRNDQPQTRFYQVSAVSGMTGYTYTDATPVSIDATTESQVELILKNATLQAPTQKQG